MVHDLQGGGRKYLMGGHEDDTQQGEQQEEGAAHAMDQHSAQGGRGMIGQAKEQKQHKPVDRPTRKRCRQDEPERYGEPLQANGFRQGRRYCQRGTPGGKEIFHGEGASGRRGASITAFIGVDPVA